MSTIADREAKVERIELRVTPNAKALLMAAAQSRHTTVSDFLLTHGLAAAEEAVAIPRVFYASEEGWATIQRLLGDDHDNQPDAKTLAWLNKRRFREGQHYEPESGIATDSDI